MLREVACAETKTPPGINLRPERLLFKLVLALIGTDLSPDLSGIWIVAAGEGNLRGVVLHIPYCCSPPGDVPRRNMIHTSKA